MYDKLEIIEKRYNELLNLLSDPNLIKDKNLFQKYNKERASLLEVVENFQRLKNIDKEVENLKILLEDNDPEIKKIAKTELGAMSLKKQELTERLKNLLIPKNPFDDKNVYLEIRAGTGGDEASLFAYDLFRMYSKYAEKQNWQIEIQDSNPTGLGGFKEIIAFISGNAVYKKLKYEGGVHRVQRVPKTEAYGRVHTSAVTVVVLPEAEDVEIEIQEKDIRVDVFRSGGHGGQSVNTTDSAVRITHLSSGIVVSIQDEKSQHKNKAKAMKILKARLLEQERQKKDEELSKTKKEMVKSGDRSEKIRTYNFPQNRLTDHRIGLTIYTLDRAMDGAIDEIIDSLQKNSKPF
jgi:peptide chain release factor 1